MPFFQQRAAIVIGGFHSVAQGLGRVAIHAGFATGNTHATRLGLSEKRINTGWMDGAKAAHAGGAVAQRQVKIARSNLGGDSGIGKADFLWEGVHIQPVDQLFAPTGDDRGLRIMHMRIHETRRNQGVAIIGDIGLGMGFSQGFSLVNRRDLAALDPNRQIGQGGEGDVILGADAEDVKSIRRILFLEEAFDLAEADARPALEAAVRQVSKSIAPIERVSLSKEGFADWLAAFNVLRPPEIWVTYGSWIEQVHPHFGPQVAQRFAAAKRAANADTRRAWVFRADKQDKAAALLGGDAVFILPTAPTIAPKIGLNDSAAAAQRENTIRLSCISPMLGLPEISIPLAVVDGCPIGLSLIAPKNADRMLLRAALDLSEAK